MKCRNYFFSLFVAFLGVFFGSCIINQNNTYAASWTSRNVRDLFSSNSGTLSFSDIGFSNDSFFSPIYFSVSIKSSGNLYNANTSNYFNFPSSWPIVRLTGPSYLQASIYDDITFSYCSDLSFSFTSSSLFYYYFYNNSFPSVTSVIFTFSDECLGSSQSSGSIELTENGTYDVSQYAEAVVNVPETDCPPSSGGGGNYHEDLVAINNSILICAAVCLVIYFFYCIYRMIIKNSGVK